MSTTPHVLIDRYEVGRLLGTGGMAEVFEGRDRLLARRVAVKVLLAQFARDPSFLIRFKREAQAAASLSHPNIVAVYDTGVEAGTNFIVMEFVEGRTLREVIRADGPLLPVRAAEVGVAVCGALAAAHARGLIHRDIKPGNVMLTGEGVVKVMDFGIARATTSETITQTSAVVGTAQYISPEQAQGLEVDYRSDVYSLGCCLFEMVTGVVPFSGATPVAIAYRHVREAPTPPSQLNPDVGAGLEAVVLKAMAKLPANRYQTAVELRADLERVLGGLPVHATPLLGEQPTQAITRSAGTGAAQTAMLGEAVPSRADPYAESYDEVADRPRSSLGWLVLVVLAVAVAALIGYLLMSRVSGSGSGGNATTPTTAAQTTPTVSQTGTTAGATTSSQQATTTKAPTTTKATTTTTRATSTTPTTGATTVSTGGGTASTTGP
jgi:eukaryotic-like serine/threonine-protein kinase